MSLWRYIAVTAEGATRRGELSGDSGAAVRASLRRIGLRVLDVRPSRRTVALGSLGSTALVRRVTEVLQRHMRARRRARRSEVHDGLATLLEAGVPLLESIETLARDAGGARSLRSMLMELRERLASGGSLASAMASQRSWFDAVEVAMVEAAEHAGTLPQVLRRLADRHERSGALAQRLATALTYPTIVLMVGVGVALFLSVRILPDLVQILRDAEVEPPALTLHVMAVGGLLVRDGWWLGPAALGGALGVLVVGALLRRTGARIPRALGRLRPRTLRRMQVGAAALQLAELVRTGVPVVSALRVVARAAPGTPAPAPGSASPDEAAGAADDRPGGSGLRGCLLRAAACIERGEGLAAALDDTHYFDAEFRRLISIGETSGELDEILERIGQRYERQAARRIDRLAALLEPAVILGLAVLVGAVVMAAVLPLVRLREVL